MYKSLIRPYFFKKDAEQAHHSMFALLQNWMFLGKQFLPKPIVDKRLERKVFGIRFKNPVGLAAGLDKDAVAIEAFDQMGFGFVEIGTLTPRPQPGNDKPRLFRLLEDEAIINRMGFNNGGVDAAIERLKKHKNIIIGGNIGKNKDTPNEKAVEDYLICFEKLFPYVSYFVVNVSSPNTPNLRALQDKEPLTKLLAALQQKNREKSSPKPILLKIAPDLSDEQLLDIIDIVKETKIAGVIATNTTLSREGLQSDKKDEQGGLSGKPLKNRSTEVIRFLHQKSGGTFPIIGVGGIHTAQDALEKLDAGASLVQLYTGFIYEGPQLIKDINTEILRQGSGPSKKH